MKKLRSVHWAALLVTLLSYMAFMWVTPALASDETDILALVNQHRAANGLPPLCLNAQLNEAARAHSADMLANNYFSHTGLNGSLPWDRIRATGYVGSYYAENIAAGYQSAAAVFEGWRTSPGHNANMLSASATEMGIARVGDYWTQVFSNANACGVTAQPASAPTRVPPQPPAVPTQSAPTTTEPDFGASEPVDSSASAQPVSDMGDDVSLDDLSYDDWVAEMTAQGYTCETTTYVDEDGVTWECTTCTGG